MSAPWMKFYPTDWRADPALRMCSVGARGLWMEMLCVMHEAVPRGSLLVNGRSVNARQLAGLAGCSVDDVISMLAELEDAGVFSREDDGTIFSRRMRRDDEKSERDKANGRKGGNPSLKTENDGVNPLHKGGDKAQKPEARDQKNCTAGAQADAPTRADLDKLEDALRDAAGTALNAASPGLLTLAPVLNLIRAGADLEQDILPAVRQVAARPSLRRGSVRSWEFFTEPIREAHARRVAEPSPLPEVPHERSRKPARQNPHDLMLAALAAECAGGDGGGRTAGEDTLFGGPH